MVGKQASTVLFVPGLRHHVEDHWQTHTANDILGSVTVEPLRENGLSCAARVAALDAAIAAIDNDVVLVAHSAGCLMVACWAQQRPRHNVRGALLVTPADIEHPMPDGYPTLDALNDNGWLPIPRQPLPFPSMLVASRNDPLARFERAEMLARCWNSTFYDAGEVGHLNPVAGFGPWPKALELLTDLEDICR